MNHRREAGRGLGLLLAIVLLAASAMPAFAATYGDVTGTFAINAAPSVTTNITETSVTPQLSYTVTVGVSDTDSIDDIHKVVMKMWYDSDSGTPSESEFDGVMTTPDEQDAVVVTWDKSGQSAVAPVLTPSGTSWSLTDYTVPSTGGDFSGTSFNWEFKVKIGKVATETTGSDKWQVAAKVTDGASATAWDPDNQGITTMNWYGEVSVSSVTVDWETVAPGLNFTDAGAQEALGTDVTYVANGAYDQKVKSGATWSGGTYTANLDATGTCDDNDEFALKADDTATYASATLVDSTGVIIDTGSQTYESGNGEANNNLWLKLASSFDKDTYSGTISYIIANHP